MWTARKTKGREMNEKERGKKRRKTAKDSSGWPFISRYLKSETVLLFIPQPHRTDFCEGCGSTHTLDECEDWINPNATERSEKKAGNVIAVARTSLSNDCRHSHRQTKNLYACLVRWRHQKINKIEEQSIRTTAENRQDQTQPESRTFEQLPVSFPNAITIFII